MNKNEMRRRARRLLPYVIALAVIVLLALAFRTPPILIETEAVTRGYLAITVEEEGRTRVMDRYVVSAPLLGQTRRIDLQVGDSVKPGQVLVTLDATASPISDVRTVAGLQARLEAARATLSTTQHEAEAQATAARQAANDLERLRKLHAEKFIAAAQLEQAEAEARRAAALARSAEFRISTAKAELEAAEAALAYAGGRNPKASGVFRLRAPVAGKVLVRHFESARVVQPGEPILEIGDPTHLEVETDVLSADAVRITPGMRVLFERWGEPEPLVGRVRRVEPRAYTRISALGVEEQRVWIIADITSPPERWARLGDRYRVNSRFILWEADNVLRIPSASLFRHGDGWAVFVVSGGRAHLRQVKIGRRGPLASELVSGVNEGERVIVHPDREIEDGSRVELRE